MMRQLFKVIQGDWYHVRCVLDNRVLSIAGNWGGGARQHAEAHVRHGEAEGVDVSWAGRKAWERYYVVEGKETGHRA